MIAVFLLVIGVVLLYLGAEGLIKGSASLALRMGLTPLVIGLTVVAYGTGTPELVVSLDASLAGKGEIAIGNIIGSNICNIGLILGLTAILKPVGVQSRIVRYDLPIMIAISAAMFLLLGDGELTRLKASLFLGGLVIYTIWVIRYSQQYDDPVLVDEFSEEMPAASRSAWLDCAFIVLGLVGLWLGARAFVEGAVTIAQAFGVSDAVIGLTLVAFGTSLPELATSLLAIMKNHRDLAIGNLIGSNIFNILAIVGTTGLARPFMITGVTWVDYTVMLGFAIVLVPLMRKDFIVSRMEGGCLLAAYLVYIYCLL
ncbi:MAG: calcium/sodium antiporter [Chlamydiales bacterium]|nr:calcium/sodium antiporter [Chlamydiia bacterium]MCP5508702.1 calcium/sodium antiporter [Chlamydiales bacterium]